MRTVRIIPCLDIKGGRVVKGVNFDNLRDARDPVEAAAAYCPARALMSWCSWISLPPLKIGRPGWTG